MTAEPLGSETLALPRKLLRPNTIWAALDCGCSLLKVVFVDKADVLNDNSTNVALHAFLYKRTDIEAALCVMKDRVFIPSGDQTINMIGTGYAFCKDAIENALNVKVIFLQEYETTASGAQTLLQHLTGEDIFHPKPANTRKYFIKNENELNKERNTLCERMTVNNHEDHGLPTNILIIGSAYIFLHIDAKGKMTTKTVPLIGGLPFLGLAKLLLGTADYDEVMSLAEKGDVASCYYVVDDCVPKGNEYGVYDRDMPVFPFARPAMEPNREFSKEDIAASLVSFFAQIAHAIALQVAESTGISRFYVSGNWVRSETARRYLLQQVSIIHPDVIDFHFFKTGLVSCLGALLTYPNDSES